MTNHPTVPLPSAVVRSLLQATLRTSQTLGSWEPPEVAVLAPYFPAYNLECLIARGGMGAVYRARQLSLNRTVAIKVLPFDLGIQPDFAERFRREAESLARLSHPHIISVHDFGQADDGHYFMVLEYVEGSDLATKLKQGGRLSAEEALRITQQVCDALDYAHRHGVVHRDIKPANLLLTQDGRVKVTDFGIAHLAHEQAAGDLTVTGTLLGTPDYTAPEQLSVGHAVDHRADIFSVGVLLYELLTGTLPRGVFRPVSSLQPCISRQVDAVLTRAMQSQPERRYGSALELSAGLQRAALPSTRLGWLVAVALLAALAAGGWLWLQAQQEDEFVNSLGLRFRPAGTAGVLFCVTETRVSDFQAYATARNLPWHGSLAVYVNYQGTRTGWEQKDGSWAHPHLSQTAEHPMVAVNQTDALSFCEWLTQHERESGRIGRKDRYRLPTNEEWSVAAGLAADAHDPALSYPWGKDFPPPSMAGNYAGEELREDALYHALPILTGRRDGHRYTAPVGSYTANAYGLYDMGGNVAEWVQVPEGQQVNTRGATWLDSEPSMMDAGSRPIVAPFSRSYILGFRIVLEQSTAP